MEYKRCTAGPTGIVPRIIIHGGAGNITPANLPKEQYDQFHSSLMTILANSHEFLMAGHDALDTVTYAAEQLENNPLFNSGRGAVFTRDGINELECSVMVTRGKKKRGVGLMGLRHVKNPSKLAREMLIRGEDDLEGGNGEHRGPMVITGEFSGKPPSGGAQGHSQLYGASAEKLAEKWGIELVDTSYFFNQKRWDEHVKGLEREKEGKGQATWDALEFVPQGTCGAVAMDSEGVIACLTSTGGMTNKLTGRIGDTPTLGAGFWAEEWEVEAKNDTESIWSDHIDQLGAGVANVIRDCFSAPLYAPLTSIHHVDITSRKAKLLRSTAMSGTGNGDSFLRMNAVRTASAIARYRGCDLQTAVSEMTGPGGELQKSAGDRWKKTGEGEGGMIGIESALKLNQDGFVSHSVSHIVDDYNCSGMFRASVNKSGKAVCRVWRPGQHEGMQRYEKEGKEYDIRDWLSEKITHK